jgi:hypothetical protein
MKESQQDLIAACRYDREANEELERAAEVERYLSNYSAASRETLKSLIASRKNTASLAKAMARQHRERAGTKETN